jgi:hypothetical protein
MPTGYAAAIADGITFPEYALRCARAFGALIEMRDDPMDAQIPDEFKVSDHYDKEIQADRKRLKEIVDASDETLDIISEAAYRSAKDSYEKMVSDRLVLKEKYEKMLAEARAYVPPTKDHVEFGKFMVQQIEESIKFDCSIIYLDAPKKQSAKEWRQAEVEKISQHLAYYVKEKNAAIKRAKDRSEWVRQLKASLNNR